MFNCCVHIIKVDFIYNYFKDYNLKKGQQYNIIYNIKMVK